MRRRIAQAVLVVLFVGGAALWEYVLKTPSRTVSLELGPDAASPRWTRVTWVVEREGREIAHGAIHARDGHLPPREVLGTLPLKRGPHVLRAGFVADGAEGDRPLLVRRITFTPGDDDVVLLSLEGGLR